ncbi:MAG: HAMP domain-containing histidine kinase, partial [Alphaproteobacteria bacterium]|nr:HAMP domain-containing histidine kinase [Alphaproteobacteria bacterium]
VAGDIALMIETMGVIDPEERARLFATTPGLTELDFSYDPDKTLVDFRSVPGRSIVESPLIGALNERVHRPYRLDFTSDPHRILVDVQLQGGVLSVGVPLQRLYTSTTYIFVLWMVGSSIVLFAVASLFMRNQVRALRRLADAAENFGKGRNVAHFKLEGAAEIRQAAAAFLVMRDRILRQIGQRTEMLAGVSHDLRTPLTRMKLALALLGEGLAIDELKSDVAEMEKMVTGYLDFARGEGTEAAVETDLSVLLEEVAATARRGGVSLSLAAPAEYPLLLRRNAMKRCIGNLLSNARRHGSHVWLTALPSRNGIDILIDDDGPGIPPEKREMVFRPFFRLDRSRNVATGGVGLGLTIARDVARGHGGELTLEGSPQGGLRARLHLPN